MIKNEEQKSGRRRKSGDEEEEGNGRVTCFLRQAFDSGSILFLAAEKMFQSPGTAADTLPAACLGEAEVIGETKITDSQALTDRCSIFEPQQRPSSPETDHWFSFPPSLPFRSHSLIDTDDRRIGTLTGTRACGCVSPDGVRCSMSETSS